MFSPRKLAMPLLTDKISSNKVKAAQPFAAADAATPRLTSRHLSQAFGLANILGYHRRAAELNRWAALCSRTRLFLAKGNVACGTGAKSNDAT